MPFYKISRHIFTTRGPGWPSGEDRWLHTTNMPPLTWALYLILTLSVMVYKHQPNYREFHRPV